MFLFTQVDASSFEFVFYKSGIYVGTSNTATSHAVVVVGYGTDPTTNTPYWIVKNSWGSKWGEVRQKSFY